MGDRINVAIGILAERRSGIWRVLISRRAEHGVLGGFWELPGGKIEGEESARECLQREFEEEVGLIIRVEEDLPVIVHRYDHGLVCLHPFFCSRIHGEPRDIQVAEHRWVTVDELPAIRFPPANDRLIAQVAEAFLRRNR